MPLVYYHFCMAYVDRLRQEKKFIMFLYLLGIIFLGFNWFSNLFTSGYYEYYWGYYPKSGPLHLVYVGVFIVGLLIRTVFIFYSQFKKKDNFKENRNKMGYAMIGVLIYSCAAFDFIVNYGFEFYPVGFIFILISLSIYSYAIVKHKILDIEIVIKRTVIFSVFFTFIVLVVGIVSTLLPFFFLQFFSFVLNPFWLSLFSVLVVSSFLIPFYHFLINWTDRFLFQKNIDYRTILGKLTNRILVSSNIDQIANITIKGFSDLLRTTNCSLWIKDVEGTSFVLKASCGEKGRTSFLLSSPLIKCFNKRLEPVYREDLPNDIDHLEELTSLLNELHSEVCFPLFVQDNLLGVLCLGQKKSHAFYMEKDIRILKNFCGGLAMSISNAILQTALAEIKILKGVVPICSNCKKIRDDEGYWNLLESYIEKYSEASFSHSMCPDCTDEFYGKEDWYIKLKNKNGI